MKCQRALPWSATASIFTLSSFAMKPITEKMTKPANILVALLVHVTINVSLRREHKELVGIRTRNTYIHTCISGVSHGHTHLGGMLVKAHFYTRQVRWVLMREHRSLHSTTSNQLCKLPSPMCHVGAAGRAGGQARLLLASLKRRGSHGDMICNPFFNSLPHEDICSP